MKTYSRSYGENCSYENIKVLSRMDLETNTFCSNLNCFRNENDTFTFDMKRTYGNVNKDARVELLN